MELSYTEVKGNYHKEKNILQEYYKSIRKEYYYMDWTVNIKMWSTDFK